MKRNVKVYKGDASKFDEKNFFNLSNYTVDDKGNVYDENNNKLKTYIRKGYKYVDLTINGKVTECKVHRIVACSFPEICGEMNEVVNHLDENKMNNSATNLKWVTNKENLEWGNIKEKRKKSVEIRSKIIKKVKEICKENDITYHKNKIRELKKYYKVKNNNFTIYLDKETLDFKKGNIVLKENKEELKEVEPSIDVINNETNFLDPYDTTIDPIDRLMMLLILFPEEIDNFKEVIKRKDIIKNIKI